MTPDTVEFVHKDEAQPIIDAVTCIVRHNINFRHISNVHIKIGRWNYHPTQGTIYRDGDKGALPVRGLSALLHALGVETSEAETPPASSLVSRIEVE